MRWGWGLLLGFSVAFNLFAGVENYAEAHCYMGNALFERAESRRRSGTTSRRCGSSPIIAEAHNNLGTALTRAGQAAGGDRTLRAGAADQARFRRGAQQPGGCLGASGQAAGGNRTLRAGAADQARLRRGAQQSGGRLGASGQSRRRRSDTTSRRCGSSPISPRHTTTWEPLWRELGRVQEAIGALRAGAADQARFRRGTQQLRGRLAASG